MLTFAGAKPCRRRPSSDLTRDSATYTIPDICFAVCVLQRVAVCCSVSACSSEMHADPRGTWRVTVQHTPYLKYVLQCVAACCSEIHAGPRGTWRVTAQHTPDVCFAACCRYALQCVAVYCATYTIPEACVALCRSLLQICVAVCCSVLHHVYHTWGMCCSVLQRVAECLSETYDAVRCSTLQCTEVCCSTL